jgi:PadR family transcriptional regulator, regulatory protein PadR
MPRTLLTDFELMLVLAVLRLGDDAYGVSIAREIESVAGRLVLLGAVYATLDRLEKAGLVKSQLGEPTPERGGRAKKYFRVTREGVRGVRETRRALTALWTNVPGLEGGRT